MIGWRVLRVRHRLFIVYKYARSMVNPGTCCSQTCWCRRWWNSQEEDDVHDLHLHGFSYKISRLKVTCENLSSLCRLEDCAHLYPALFLVQALCFCLYDLWQIRWSRDFSFLGELLVSLCVCVCVFCFWGCKFSCVQWSDGVEWSGACLINSVEDESVNMKKSGNLWRTQVEFNTKHRESSPRESWD